MRGHQPGQLGVGEKVEAAPKSVICPAFTSPCLAVNKPVRTTGEPLNDVRRGGMANNRTTRHNRAAGQEQEGQPFHLLVTVTVGAACKDEDTAAIEAAIVGASFAA